ALKGNNINLNAQNTLLNQSGDITANNNLNLMAKTLTNIANQQTTTQKRDTTTTIGKASNLKGKNININAKDVRNTASNITAQDLTITANNLNITTQQNTTDLKAGSGDNYSNSQSTQHQGSHIKVAGDLNINADNINIQGSKVSANNATIKSDNLNIAAVQDSKATQMKASHKGFLSSSVSIDTKATATNIASNLSANNLTLKTTKEDINITGSNIEAQQQLSLDSAKDINIQAGYDGSLNESYSKTSGFSLAGLVGIGSLYSSTEDLEGRIKRTAVNSTLSGNNITLNANNNIHVVGVDIQADNSISGNAKDINIQNANNTDTNYSKHKKIEVSLADVLGNIVKNPLILKKESDGKVSFTLATATIDKETKHSTQSTVQRSNINAGAAGIRLTANDKQLGKQSGKQATKQTNNQSTNQANNNPTNQVQGNITLTGVNLSATDGDINLTANNNVNIKAALETTTTNSSELHGKADIKFVVKNEYVQIKPAIEAVKDAKQNLSKAKDAYSAYKQDLVQQQAQLQALKAQLQADTGYIEQIDIDEMSELVNDLQADKKYYQANIALATSSLAAKTTALITQVATATASSGTYGFNAGIELDIDTLEKQLNSQQTKSIASHLVANNININANANANKTTTIVGSNLQANTDNGQININAQNLNILSSQDTSNTESNTDHKNLNVSYSVYGATSDSLKGSISKDSSTSNSQQTKHNNTSLTAANINLNSTQDTLIKGANLHATNQLNINSKNLAVS
ncbi:hypothetical protein AZO1586R_402, partial [Bathymodiolus azoricus thioautotrophic gill symbiont]